jgi:hypothetical protein
MSADVTEATPSRRRDRLPTPTRWTSVPSHTADIAAGGGIAAPPNRNCRPTSSDEHSSTYGPTSDSSNRLRWTRRVRQRSGSRPDAGALVIRRT